MEIIKNLITKTFSSATSVFIIILITLLTSSLTLNFYQNKKVTEARKEVVAFGLINVGLNQTIADLKEEIRTKPAQYIEATREMDKELCKGESLVDQINSIPKSPKLSLQSSRVASISTTEAPHEQNDYVDIDGLLPPELTRLLK